MSKKFGEHLRSLRKERTKYSQKEMAELLFVARSTYTYYETGKSFPSEDKLEKLCKILNIDYNTLLGYNKP